MGPIGSTQSEMVQHVKEMWRLSVAGLKLRVRSFSAIATFNVPKALFKSDFFSNHTVEYEP